MENRREFLLSLGALAAAAQLRAEHDEDKHDDEGPSIKLPAPFNGRSATFADLDVPPGHGEPAPHRHPGFVIGYIVDGSVRFQVKGQPVQTLHKGQTFCEQPGAVHLLLESADPQNHARVLAIVIAETGKPIVEPA